jgi:hypothetical protein
MKSPLQSKTVHFFGYIWPILATMLNSAIDNIELLHSTIGDFKYWIAVIISSGAGLILRKYTNTGLGATNESACDKS